VDDVFLCNDVPNDGTRRLLDVQDSSFSDPFAEVNAVAFLAKAGFPSLGSDLQLDLDS